MEVQEALIEMVNFTKENANKIGMALKNISRVLNELADK